MAIQKTVPRTAGKAAGRTLEQPVGYFTKSKSGGSVPSDAKNRQSSFSAGANKTGAGESFAKKTLRFANSNYVTAQRSSPRR